MKKNKGKIITVVSILVIIIISLVIFYKFFYDANKLNIKEKEWLDDNKSAVININVPNNLNVFGYNGIGVFFDFLEQFEKKHLVSFNEVPIDTSSDSLELGFVISKDITSSDLPIYKDHYVLISKNEEVITDYSDISGSAIGVLSSTLTRISNIYSDTMVYTTYETRDELIEGLKSEAVKYLIVPKIEYLDVILLNNYKMIYHFGDLTLNYYLRLGSDKVLNSILTKYYNVWIEEDYEETYYDYLYNLYVEKLGLTQVETDTLTNKDYVYGFVPSSPYHTLASSNYGGIAMAYLSDFSNFSGVEFTYNKYKNIERLIKGFNDNKLDLLFHDTNVDIGRNNIYTNLNNKYYIISPLEKELYLASIKEISNEKITVIENSKLYGYLNTIPDARIEVVDNEKELFKATKNKEIIAIDANTYDYYVNKEIKDYSIRYIGFANQNYSFEYVNNTDAFYKLFSTYITSLDQKSLINQGLISYKSADYSGNIIASLAKYTLLVIGLGTIILSVVHYTKNKIILNTKIKKDEKLKFIDLLTSLKNRNYLNEKKNSWNQNTIYPQGVIIIDLNKVKFLNDTYGPDEGDKQIKAAANILIKTQLDNSEVMRTDGNEFMVYLVGYSEKQVLNYMKKLVREFKGLPHEYGAAFGFSMIVDDLKLIDDALAEATIQMRENKEKSEVNNETSEE
ncbi:MAG: GGDEF domain-containing protein [Bacilli bacterium]|nr:GGDEF domain-containing protein [Bacilli bacterium]MDD4795550.1 GGDEF domain-containing protein [Bacilli bacterium]